MEVIPNNQPLGYLEDDIQCMAKTSQLLIKSWMMNLIYIVPFHKGCLSTWTYVKFYGKAGEKSIYNLCLRNNAPMLGVGDIAQIKAGQQNRWEWQIVVVTKLVMPRATQLLVQRSRKHQFCGNTNSIPDSIGASLSL